MAWRQIPAPPEFTFQWRAMNGEVPVPRFHANGTLHALVGREPAGEGPDRWHISLSHDDRLPSWDELVNAAHELRPGIPFALGIPPRSWWLNVHRYTLHLWELRDPFLVAQWQREARGDRPT